MNEKKRLSGVRRLVNLCPAPVQTNVIVRVDVKASAAAEDAVRHTKISYVTRKGDTLSEDSQT